MSVLRGPNAKWYWVGQRRGAIPTGSAFSFPDFTRHMSYHRFVQIRKILRFADYSKPSNMDPLWKVRPIIDLVRKIIEEGMPNLSKQQSLDERRVPFKGRFPCKRIMTSKPIRIGWTLPAAVDLPTHYMWSVFVEDGILNSKSCGDKPWKMRGEQILTHVRIAHRHGHKDIHCFVDRLYASVPLAVEIMRMGSDFTGVVMANRGVPKEVRLTCKKPSAAEPRGTVNSSHILTESGQLNCWGIMDNGPCYFLDTFNGGSTSSELHKQKDGTLIKYDFPIAQKQYNVGMGGCDQVDQGTANRQGWGCTTMCIRTHRWPIRLGCDGMFDILHGNGFAIEKVVHRERKYDRYDWLLAVADDLLTKDFTVPRTRSSATNETPAKRSISHSVASPTNSEHRNASVHKLLGDVYGGYCAYCQLQKKPSARNRVVKGCSTCKTYLHNGICHQLFHRMLAEDPELLSKVKRRKIVSRFDGRTLQGKAARALQMIGQG